MIFYKNMPENVAGHRRRRERGVALLMTLIVLSIVTSVGLSLMFMADTETNINSNFRDEQVAYYAARAGLEEVRDRMRSAATDSISAKLPTALPGAAGSVLYITNASAGETVAPWLATNKYWDDEICKEVSCAGGQVPPTSGWYVSPVLTASSSYAASPILPYKWMRMTIKTNKSAFGSSNIMYVDGKSANAAYYVCWNGTNEIAQSTACASPNKTVYLLTTLALTASGTRRMLQYELTTDSLNLTFGSALSLDGTSDVMSGPNSNGFNVSGIDHAGCAGSAVQSAKPAIGVSDSADVATVISGIPGNRQSNYTGSGTAPDVENISSTMPAAFNTVGGLQGLLSTIKANVTQPVLTGTQNSLSNPGTSSSPQIIYVDGDLSLSGSVTGYGILVVTGTFTPGGDVGWRGLVLVVGKGVVTGNGGGNNEYDGAFVVAKILDSSGNPLATLGSPTFNFSGGGGNGINYSGGCITQATYISDYRIVSQREMMY
jgi:hypothetical protein